MARSSRTRGRDAITASGATAAIQAAVRSAVSAGNSSVNPPPASAAATTATLNHDHCWFTNALEALKRWPVSTSNAPQTVLAVAIAIAVTTSALMIPSGTRAIAVHANAVEAAAAASSK